MMILRQEHETITICNHFGGNGDIYIYIYIIYIHIYICPSYIKPNKECDGCSVSVHYELFSLYRVVTRWYWILCLAGRLGLR